MSLFARCRPTQPRRGAAVAAGGSLLLLPVAADAAGIRQFTD